MNKRSLSQVLDGAAFPAIMLAIAVSQIRVGSNQKNTPHQAERLAPEIQVSDRVEQRAKEAQRQ